jgi:hypothetical protein
VHRVALVLAALALFVPTAGGSSGMSTPLTAIFYYPWYGTPARDGGYDKWEQNGHRPAADLASAFYPSRGAYSSSDPGVLDAQMQEIERAGIREVVVSWWGRGSPEDERLPALMQAAQAHSLDIAAHLEPYAGRTIAGTAEDIDYLRTVGIRDFFVYHATDFTTAAWQQLNSTLDGVRMFAQTPLAGWAKAGGFDGMYTYDTLTYRGPMFARMCAAAHRLGLLCVPSVGPGYSALRATGDTRVLARRRGATYDSMWRAAILSGADAATITSYNEWNEGTQIEPACRHAGYDSYTGAWGLRGRLAELAYLNRTRYWISRFVLQNRIPRGAVDQGG